jgi:Zn-finger in ubiquitin-hydrolases and other protein
MAPFCSHLAPDAEVNAPRDVCEVCVAIGGTWVNLRQCLACGATLCCDSSPNRHMTAHFGASGHPMMRSAMPDQDWTWCFVDEALIRHTPDGWETYDPFIEAGAAIARVHLAGGGSASPPADFLTRDGFPLGEWFAHVRGARATGDLDAREVALVEALPGWRWA